MLLALFFPVNTVNQALDNHAAGIRTFQEAAAP